jgi:hypothetical protein
MCRLEFSPPFVRLISRPRPFLNRQGGCGSVRLRMGRVDHDDLGLLRLRRQFSQVLGEHAHPVPPFQAVVGRLWRSTHLRRIGSARPIVIDEDNAAQNTPIINTWLSMALWKIGPKPRHLPVD